MEYKILTVGKPGPAAENALAALEEAVNAHIRFGWRPLGGFAWAPQGETAPGSTSEKPIPFFYASQAMTKD